MTGRPYAVVPGERAAADICPGTLAGLEAAMRRAMALSKDGPPRVIRKDGKVLKRFEGGQEVRDIESAI
jgi:hypothetical protein